MRLYEERGDGSIYFYGIDHEDGTWIPAPRCIDEWEEDFPEPECGDCLRLSHMPLDNSDGLHATRYAYYSCVCHDTSTNEPVYGWIVDSETKDPRAKLEKEKT